MRAGVAGWAGDETGNVCDGARIHHELDAALAAIESDEGAAHSIEAMLSKCRAAFARDGGVGEWTGGVAERAARAARGMAPEGREPFAGGCALHQQAALNFICSPVCSPGLEDSTSGREFDLGFCTADENAQQKSHRIP